MSTMASFAAMAAAALTTTKWVWENEQNIRMSDRKMQGMVFDGFIYLNCICPIILCS